LRRRICSVDFLNSTPLVWGLLHGPQKGLFDLTFRIPSLCAEMVVAGDAEIGNIPVIEYARQGLGFVRGPGVACHGPVRSILLISKVPLDRIHTLAADRSSRTSVGLTRIVLEKRYGVRPEFHSAAPDLEAMLGNSDAALIIGDPALRIDPSRVPYQVTDLGEEWVAMTGLPMVFAVWAGRPEVLTPKVGDALRASCRYGRERLDEVIAHEVEARGFAEPLAREYLTHHIVNELTGRDYAGMDLYLRYAREAGLIETSAPALTA